MSHYRERPEQAGQVSHRQQVPVSCLAACRPWPAWARHEREKVWQAALPGCGERPFITRVSWLSNNPPPGTVTFHSSAPHHASHASTSPKRFSLCLLKNKEKKSPWHAELLSQDSRLTPPLWELIGYSVPLGAFFRLFTGQAHILARADGSNNNCYIPRKGQNQEKSTLWCWSKSSALRITSSKFFERENNYTKLIKRTVHSRIINSF